MGRVSTSVSMTEEEAEFLKNEKMSPTAVLHKAIQRMMTGAYDEDREGLIDELYERFIKQGKGRSFAQAKNWLESPSWKDDLSAVGLTPMGFMLLCRKRIESLGDNGVDSLLQYTTGIIDEIPASAIKMPPLSPARRRYLQQQEEMALQWEKDMEEQADVERTD